ncbi:MAG: MOSC domain-containing protein [Rhodospirillales bacterium]|nr:MOSC domain-containing protein [Rhodospirillales bacterium]
MQARLESIVRYPVKGLAGQALERAQLTDGKALPHDRRFALTYDSGAPGDKLHHASLAGLEKEERLASLTLDYDEDTTAVTLYRDGKQVARGEGSRPIGRPLLTQFFSAYLKDSPRGTARFVENAKGHFTYWDEPFLHLINLATVKDLERVARQPIDPRRFRANLWIGAPPAWEERHWVGKRLRLGEARLEAVALTERCAATTVNPDNAKHDLNVPRILRAGFGHLELGLYLRVVRDGTIAVGDSLEII